MGTCQMCGIDRHNKIVMNTEVIRMDWSSAVINNSIVGIKVLHQNDFYLINQPVDKYGCTAIHYAVRNKNQQILLYLLQDGHGADINVQGGPNYNSALHEAALINDFNSITILYRYNIKEQLKNNDNKTAIQLCIDPREFIKAKEFALSENNSDPRRSTVLFHGKKLRQTHKHIIRKILKETNDVQVVTIHKQEIEHREEHITMFGEECGVEVDEVAMVLIDNNPKKIWNKLNKSKRKCLTKQTDIYKILFGLTYCAIKKKKHPHKPPIHAIKKLTTKLCKKLPKKKGRPILEKEIFVEKFHTYLFELHDDMVAKHHGHFHEEHHDHFHGESFHEHI
eukprot:454095_1